MLKTHRRMKLSPEEELFLRQLDRYEEAHYQDVPVPAKRLQIERGVRPAELAHLIAAAPIGFATKKVSGLSGTLHRCAKNVESAQAQGSRHLVCAPPYQRRRPAGGATRL